MKAKKTKASAAPAPSAPRPATLIHPSQEAQLRAAGVAAVRYFEALEVNRHGVFPEADAARMEEEAYTHFARAVEPLMYALDGTPFDAPQDAPGAPGAQAEVDEDDPDPFGGFNLQDIVQHKKKKRIGIIVAMNGNTQEATVATARGAFVASFDDIEHTKQAPGE